MCFFTLSLYFGGTRIFLLDLGCHQIVRGIIGVVWYKLVTFEKLRECPMEGSSRKGRGDKSRV
jgi:hypothetical protein